MLSAAEEAMQFVAGRERADLDADRKLGLALVRLLEIIGEAAAGTPKTFRDANPQIPWRAIIAMRNLLIHTYFSVNLDIVWRTVTQDLPPFAAAIRALLNP